MGHAHHRQHVVLAEADEADVLEHDELIVAAHFLEGPLQIIAWFDFVPGELSAELFQRQGYKVTITPQTRDGGKDLYLAKADGFGSFLYIVECKRYASDNPVDVGVVRSLYGVAQHERVTAAMTLTTSYFSKDAQNFAAEVQYQLALKDFFDLKLLLAPYGRAD